MGELGADEWVLSKYSEPGFFVDIGCADGIEHSNTYELEKRGWKGICIDAYPRNFGTRTCIVEQAVLGSEPDKEVCFVRSIEIPNLSGVINNLCDWHKERVLHSKNEKELHKTRVLSDILNTYDAPKFIEYMNLDIEGNEYEVLSTFPFDKYTFGCISVEHNFQEPNRTNIRNLLLSKGYIFEKEVKWDDWYVTSKTTYTESTE